MALETAEDVVRSVVASAELDGRTIDPHWRQILLRVAHGELKADEAVRMAREQLAMVVKG